MILVDTSVWIDHFRYNNTGLGGLLQNNQVLSHPFIVGELAIGSLRQRSTVLEDLQALPAAVVAHDDEVLGLIQRQSLFGTGVGYIDAHLLASVLMTRGALLFTRDKRLLDVGRKLSVAFEL